MSRSPGPSRSSCSWLRRCSCCASGLALRPGLWGDEIFSLAMATGHSLEHPARGGSPPGATSSSRPGAESPPVFRRYAEHERPAGRVRPSDPGRRCSPTPIRRCTTCCSTPGPGLSAPAMPRSGCFSVLWAALPAPFIWLLGRDLGGRAMAWTAASSSPFAGQPVLFPRRPDVLAAVVPADSTGMADAPAVADGPRPTGAGAWIVARRLRSPDPLLLPLRLTRHSASGCSSWPGRDAAHRRRRAGGVAALRWPPWYARSRPASRRWRITGNWLATPLGWPERATRPFELAWSLLAGGSYWGGSPLVDGMLAARLLPAWPSGCCAADGCGSCSRPTVLLLWLWVAAAILGALRLRSGPPHQRIPDAALRPRGLPAAMLLAALALATLRPKTNAAFPGLVVVAWTAGLWPIVAHRARPQAAYRALAAQLEPWADPSTWCWCTRSLQESSALAATSSAICRSFLGRSARAAACPTTSSACSPDVRAWHWSRSTAWPAIPGGAVAPGARAAGRSPGLHRHVGLLTADLGSLPRLLLAPCTNQLIEVLYFEPRGGDVFFSGPPIDPRARSRRRRTPAATGPASRSTTGIA